MLKEKDLNVPKRIEQRQQNTYDRKNKKNTIPETLTINRENEIKEEPVHKITNTGKYVTRTKERPNERNCRYSNAPNWNLNQKCPARESTCNNCQKGRFAKVCRLEHRRQQGSKEITEPKETEESNTDKSKIVFNQSKTR